MQLYRLNHDAEAALAREGSWPPRWTAPGDLERVADEAIERLRARRRAIARGPAAALERFERAVDCDTVELLDRPEFGEANRLALIRQLHRFNQRLLNYHRFLAMLRPFVDEVVARTGRTARLLELASGAGEFTLALARAAEYRGLPVTITGSDIVRTYVDDANRRATAEDLPVRFRRLNAFDLDVDAGAYDLVFIVQSMHHFSPGQLAMMVAQAGAKGARHFVGIDGRRSLLVLGAAPLLTALIGDRHLLHDGMISARRFYAEAELSLAARVAAPDARVSVRPAHPGYSVLHVEYPS